MQPQYVNSIISKTAVTENAPKKHNKKTALIVLKTKIQQIFDYQKPISIDHVIIYRFGRRRRRGCTFLLLKNRILLQNPLPANFSLAQIAKNFGQS